MFQNMILSSYINNLTVEKTQTICEVLQCEVSREDIVKILPLLKQYGSSLSNDYDRSIFIKKVAGLTSPATALQIRNLFDKLLKIFL